MLPVNRYTDDPTLGERQNKQYTNKYIVVYIFLNIASPQQLMDRGTIKVAAEVQGKVGQNSFKLTLNCLDVKPCDSQSYNNITCDLKSCLCM